MSSVPDPPSAVAPTTGRLLLCVAGPDLGKRLRVGPEAATVGRSAGCNLASDDPEVAPTHATIRPEGDGVRIEASERATLLIDGQRMASAVLRPGSQLRLGRSYWELAEDGTRPAASAPGGTAPVPGTPARGPRLGELVAVALDRDTDTPRLKGFSFNRLLAATFRRHGDDEIERIFAAGTPGNTPALGQIPPGWPAPWLFFRLLVPVVAAYLVLRLSWAWWGNLFNIPGLIAVGSIAIPMAVVVFLFEMNVPRNVSVNQVLRMFLLGGVLALVFTSIGFDLARGFSWLGASLAGPVEESSKLAAVLLVARQARFPWSLNGLLLGGAVGAGFAAFESAGYALWVGLESGAWQATFNNVALRAALAPGGHVAWTALAAAALWRVRAGRPFRAAMLKDWTFLRMFLFVVALHMIWNLPASSTTEILVRHAIEIVVVWVVLLRQIQFGLGEVAAAKDPASTPAPEAPVPPSAPPAAAPMPPTNL